MKTKSKSSDASALSSGSAASAGSAQPSPSRPAPRSSTTTRAASRTFTHEEISARARAIWEREGRPEGRDKDHWIQAERELREQEVKATDERRFADPDRLLDPMGEPADEVDRRLAEIATPPAGRSQTSL